MLNESNGLICERITFWLEPDKDIEISKRIDGDTQYIQFAMPYSVNRIAFITDFLIMNYDTLKYINRTYGSIYQIDENGNLTGISKVHPQTMDTTIYRHYPYTEEFFNITYKGFGDGANTIEYISKYHR